MAAEASAAPPPAPPVASELGAEALPGSLLGAGEAEPLPMASDERSAGPDLPQEPVDGEGAAPGDFVQTGPSDCEWRLREVAADGGEPGGEEGEELEGEGNDLELLALEPGQMRLQGSFQGVATTHTHQLDLAVGLDVEMPSAVAAEAIRQINRRSRSCSPDKLLARSASPGPRPPLELRDERRTLWNTLSDFFRRDAQEGARRAAAASGQRTLPDLRLKVEDPSHYKQETQRLTLDLESSQGQAAQLEARAVTLMEENDSLRSKLELLMQEYSEQTMHMDGLREQGERCLSSGEHLNSELAEREAEVRALEAKLAEALQSLDAARADNTQEQVGRDRLESSLVAARRSHELIAEENRTLKVELAELSARTAGEAASFAAKVQGLEAAVAAAPPREQHDELAEQLRSAALERDELSSGLAALESERGALAARLAAAEAEASAASAAAARASELEVQVHTLQEQSAKLQQEVLELRKQCTLLQAELERERVATAQAEVAATPVGEEDLLGEFGRLQLQLEEQQRQNEALQSSLLGLQAELAQQDEARAAAQAQASEARGALATAELSIEQLRREREGLLAKAVREGELSEQAAAEQQEKASAAEERRALREKLERAAAEVASLSAELARAKGEAASQERAAGVLRGQHLDALREATTMQAKVAELETQHSDHRAQTSAEAQARERRLAAAEKDAAEAGQKARKATEERDAARQELRQERQASLGVSARSQEELHALRQRELQASARSAALEEEVRQLHARCATLAQEALNARSSMVVSEPVAGGQVLLHDPSVGNCLIKSVTSVPTTSFGSYQLSQSMGHQPRRSVAGKSVKHIGTTTRVLGGPPGSPAVLASQAVPTSPQGTGQSLPTSPMTAGMSFGAFPVSPVPTASGLPLGSPSPVPTASGLPLGSPGPVVVSAPPSAVVTTVGPASPQMVTMPRQPRVTVAHAVGAAAAPVQGNVTVQILGVRRLKQ